MYDTPILDMYFPDCLPKMEYKEVHHAEEAAKEIIERSTLLSRVPWPVVGAIALPLLGANYILHPVDSHVCVWAQSSKTSKWTRQTFFSTVRPPLYAKMGYASYLVWKDGGGFSGARLPLAMYGLQLALNFFWTSKNNLKMAFINNLLVDVAAVGTTIMFHDVTPLAGYMMVPCLVWLSLATAFNYRRWRDSAEA
uniref:TspO/MBR-related protein n=1 Tax=Graphocephala atropunctata TaxID=36148 RepID=A0A1B6MRF1_9HEMI